MLRQAACALVLARQATHAGACCSGAVRHASSSGTGLSGLANVIAVESGKTRLQGYLPNGFIINNAQVEGAVLCLPDMWLMWDVGSFADVGSASLAMLRLMSPPPEVLVLGCGAEMRPLPAQLQDELVSRGIAVEALDTRNAIATFNFLNDEGRIVVGALLPWGLESGWAVDQKGSSSDGDSAGQQR